MRNFTDESILSLMITFGIQGVMLVLAWFIGVRVTEHVFDANPFAATGEQSGLRRLMHRAFEALVIIMLSLVCVYFVSGFVFGKSLGSVADLRAFEFSQLLLLIFAVSLIIWLATNFSGIIMQAILNIFQFSFRNVVPIFMLAMCMFTSVFFSFDALFATILPAEERGRIAELRSKSDVTSIINEMQSAAERSRRSEARALLSSREWSSYDLALKKVAAALREAPGAVGGEIESTQQRALADARRRDKILSDLAGKRRAALQSKASLSDLLGKETKRAKQLREQVARFDQMVFTHDRLIVEKTAEIDAELRGIGVTSRPGRGPEYRKLNSELVRLRETRANADLRRSSYRQQDARSQAQIAKYRTAVAAVDSKLEQLDSRIEQQRVKADSGPRPITMSAVRARTDEHLGTLERARVGFENNPTGATLAKLQSDCIASAAYASSLAAVSNTAALKLDRSLCGASATQAAAGRVFALNKARTAFNDRCIAPGAKAAGATIESRLSFARDCLSLSALLPAQSKSIVADINALERERDDKAHRFVVTYNAFSDGNKLALLAAAIAGAIDFLVLASGLLGAAAVRSPLAGRGLRQNLSASEREVIIETSLLPDVGPSARYALAQFVPHAATQGRRARKWTHELAIGDLGDETQVAVLRRLMNAGMIIDAVKADDTRIGVFAINLSLVEFLAKLARTADASDDTQQEFRRHFTRSLGDNPNEKARTILTYFIPSLRYDGYSSRVDLQAVDPDHAEVLKHCLNVASAFGFVAQGEDEDDGEAVLVSADVYLVLLRLSDDFEESQQADDNIEYRTNDTAATIGEHRVSDVSEAHAPIAPAVAALPAAPRPDLPVRQHQPHREDQVAKTPAAVDEPRTPAQSVDRVAPPAASERQDAGASEARDETDRPAAKPKQSPKILVGNDSFSFD